MTGEIVTKEYFGNIPVRVVQHDGVAAIPLIDIADGVGLDRSGLRKLLKRNERILGNYVLRVIMSSSQGDVETICMTRDGVVGILMKTDFGKMKDPDKQANVISFQRWAIETLSKIISGEVIPAPTRSHSEDVREALKVARIISEETGVSLPIAQSFALEKVGAAEWQKLLPATIMPSGYLTPTDIGNRIGKTARQVNLWLYNNKLQEQDAASGDWRLTEAGRMHAEEFPFTRNGHSGYQIKWRDSVLQLMNVRPLPDPQAALIAG